MIRRLLIAASAFSMLLSAAIAVLWLRSHFRSDGVFLVRNGSSRRANDGRKSEFVDTVSVRSMAGEIGFGRSLFLRGDSNLLAQLRSGSSSRQLEVVAHPHDANAIASRADWGTLRSPDAPWTRLGFRFMRTRTYCYPAGEVLAFDDYGIWVPYWSIVVSIIPASVWPVVRWVRTARRRRAGRCECGYDLRASQERCPECGRPIRSPRESRT